MTIKNALLCAFLLAMLSGCKIILTTSDDGYVTSTSGLYDCGSGQTCEIDVSDLSFDETFTAVPNEGFTFSGWKRRQRGFCGGSSEPCRLFTEPFEGNDVLMGFLSNPNEIFYLEPVFSQGTASKTGVIQGPVSGLSYTTSSGVSGKVSQDGRFGYESGDFIEFFIGITSLSVVQAGKDIPLRELTGDINSTEGQRKAQVLVSLDRDGNVRNGVQLDPSITSTMERIDWADTADVNLLFSEAKSGQQSLQLSDAAVSDLLGLDITTAKPPRLNNVGTGSYKALQINRDAECAAGFSDATMNVASLNPLRIQLQLDSGEVFNVDQTASALFSNEPAFTNPGSVISNGKQYLLAQWIFNTGNPPQYGNRLNSSILGSVTETDPDKFASLVSVFYLRDANKCTVEILFSMNREAKKGLVDNNYHPANRGGSSVELATCSPSGNADLYHALGELDITPFGGNLKVSGLVRNNVTDTEETVDFECDKKSVDPGRVREKGSSTQNCHLEFGDVATCDDKRQAREQNIDLIYSEYTVSVGGEQVYKVVNGKREAPISQDGLLVYTIRGEYDFEGNLLDTVSTEFYLSSELVDVSICSELRWVGPNEGLLVEGWDGSSVSINNGEVSFNAGDGDILGAGLGRCPSRYRSGARCADDETIYYVLGSESGRSGADACTNVVGGELL